MKVLLSMLLLECRGLCGIGAEHLIQVGYGNDLFFLAHK